MRRGGAGSGGRRPARFHRGAEHDDHVVAADMRLVGDLLIEIEYHTRAAIGFGRDHGVHAVGADIDAARGQRDARVGQVERDTRGLIDGEGERLGRRSGQMQGHLQLVGIEFLNVDRLQLVDGAAVASAPASAACALIPASMLVAQSRAIQRIRPRSI